MDRRHFLGGVAAATLGFATLATLPGPPDSPGRSGFAETPSAVRRRNRFLNVALTTHEGREVRFYDDLIKGKTVLLNCMYTVCTAEAICPLGTANLVEVQEMLGPRVGKDIFFYSITLDPENDTPGVLERYAKAFGVKPGWEFLTGEKENIERLRRNLGYANLDPVKDRDPSQHSGMVRYGIEPLERWAACPILSRPKAIAGYLSWLEPEGGRPTPG
ncbi:MAG TPA: SCO family protein [Candidatus Deferrimicrobiaceae bacterium]